MAINLGLGDAMQQIVDLHRKIDGQIWNQTTLAFEPATQATKDAAATAISGVVTALAGGISVPLSLGLLGSLDRPALNNALAQMVLAMKPYAVATTKS
jgi:hypothetical protein